MSLDLPYESLTTVSDLIRRKRLSSAEVTEALLRRIVQLDGQYRSYATVLPERALTRAKAADAEIARGLWRGPLHGVPIAVKDLCYTTFAPTSGWRHDFQELRSILQRHRCGAPRGRRRNPPRKAADDGRAPIRRITRKCRRSSQSVEHELLGGLIFDRIRRRDVVRALLRQPGQRHGRVDPVSLRHLRSYRHQADMGPGQPLRRLSARRHAGPRRSDDAIRRQTPPRFSESSPARTETTRQPTRRPSQTISRRSATGYAACGSASIGATLMTGSMGKSSRR